GTIIGFLRWSESRRIDPPGPDLSSTDQKRRPPPPPGPRPPPPPPSRALASFTFRARPPKSLPSSACMAGVASAFDISTNPNPRGRPVSRSVMSANDSTVPCAANNARTASSVAEKGRLPTNNLVTRKYSLQNRTYGSTRLPPRIGMLLRWQALAGILADWGGTQARVRQNERSRAGVHLTTNLARCAEVSLQDVRRCGEDCVSSPVYRGGGVEAPVAAMTATGRS